MDIKTKFEFGEKVYIVGHDYCIDFAEISFIEIKRKADGTCEVEYFFAPTQMKDYLTSVGKNENEICATFEEAKELAKKRALKKYQDLVSFVESQKKPE